MGVWPKAHVIVTADNPQQALVLSVEVHGIGLRHPGETSCRKGDQVTHVNHCKSGFVSSVRQQISTSRILVTRVRAFKTFSIGNSCQDSLTYRSLLPATS